MTVRTSAISDVDTSVNTNIHTDVDVAANTISVAFPSNAAQPPSKPQSGGGGDIALPQVACCSPQDALAWIDALLGILMGGDRDAPRLLAAAVRHWRRACEEARQ